MAMDGCTWALTTGTIAVDDGRRIEGSFQNNLWDAYHYLIKHVITDIESDKRAKSMKTVIETLFNKNSGQTIDIARNVPYFANMFIPLPAEMLYDSIVFASNNRENPYRSYSAYTSRVLNDKSVTALFFDYLDSSNSQGLKITLGKMPHDRNDVQAVYSIKQ